MRRFRSLRRKQVAVLRIEKKLFCNDNFQNLARRQFFENSIILESHKVRQGGRKQRK